MNFIQEKQLADSESGQGDLLLYIADSYCCYLTDMASSANSELKAFETILGWIISGGTPSTLYEEAVCRRVKNTKRLPTKSVSVYGKWTKFLERKNS